MPITTEIEYATATKADLWKVLKELEQIDPNTPSGDLCQANCKEIAMKHIVWRHGWGWTLRPFGMRGIPSYVQGPQVTYCPFCGRRLTDGQ